VRKGRGEVRSRGGLGRSPTDREDATHGGKDGGVTFGAGRRGDPHAPRRRGRPRERVRQKLTASPQFSLSCSDPESRWYFISMKLSIRCVSGKVTPASAASPPLIAEVWVSGMPSCGAFTSFDRKWMPRPAPTNGAQPWCANMKRPSTP